MKMKKITALVILSESIRNKEIVKSLIDRAKSEGISVIVVNGWVEGCFNILLDYDSSFEKIVRHVIEYHGCKKVNFVAGFRGNEFSDARIEIYKRVLSENGISVDDNRIGYGDFWEMPTRRLCEQWFEDINDLPEAIICANDIMAITVLNELNNRGIKVPEDVIVTGFDGLELGQYCSPKLTTAKDDVMQLGKHIRELENLL